MEEEPIKEDSLESDSREEDKKKDIDIEVPAAILEELTSLKGVGKELAKKLYQSGFATTLAIAVAPPNELSAETGIGIGKINNIVFAAREHCGVTFETADILLEKRKEVEHFTTGSDGLDDLIGGGIETKSMIEAYGEFRTGKTQIGIQLCITVQLPKDHGGLNGRALYIDCEGTFRPERVLEIAKRYSDILKDEKQVLQNIEFIRAFNSDHLKFIIDSIPNLLLKQNTRPLKLVVLDSIISHFRAEYTGRGTLADRQQKINRLLHKLLQIAEAHNLAIYYTNQVESNPQQFYGDPTHPTGGHVVAHASTFRIYIRKGKENKRVAKLVDSPCLPEKETAFIICQEGIKDP
jgi:DNA repair protein RadA